MERVLVNGDFGKAKLPEPPDNLNEAQAAIWRAVVASEPPELFATDAVRAMLHDYCQRRETAATLGLIINSFKPAWIRSEEGSKRYALLLKMRDLEVRAVTSLATKLRLTNQSRYTAERAGTMTRNFPQAKPWDL